MAGAEKCFLYEAYLEWNKGEEEKRKIIIDGGGLDKKKCAAVAYVWLGLGLRRIICDPMSANFCWIMRM